MRRTLVLVLVLFSATLGARAAYACSCAGQPTVREAVAQAEVAFVGTVTGRLGGDRYAVRVHGVLKGDVGTQARVKVWGGDSASCGTSLDEGPLLYAAGRDLEVNACTPRWTGDQVAPALARSGLTPTAPDPAVAPVGPDGGTGRWVAFAVLAVAALGAVVLVRRRRAARPESPA